MYWRSIATVKEAVATVSNIAELTFVAEVINVVDISGKVVFAGSGECIKS